MFRYYQNPLRALGYGAAGAGLSYLTSYAKRKLAAAAYDDRKRKVDRFENNVSSYGGDIGKTKGATFKGGSKTITKRSTRRNIKIGRSISTLE